MKRLAVATGALVLVMAPAAHAAPPPDLTYVPAPELTPFFDKAFGDKFKVAGVPQVMAPDESVILFNGYLRPVLSVPVAFRRTARLEQDVSIPLAPADAKFPLTMPKGTMLYQTVFKRSAAESRPIEAWCGVVLWHIYGHDHHVTKCLVKTPEGKAVAYDGDPYDNESDTYEDVKANVYAPHWFAFRLEDHASQPFDYPAITETDMPSPDMAIILRFDHAYKEKATGKHYLIGAWALRGPKGATPTTGALNPIVLPADDGKVVVPIYDHQLEMAYTPEGVTLRFAKLSAREVPVAAAPAQIPAKAAPADIVDEPWLFGSMAIDPATVTITSTPLKSGDIFLTAGGHLSQRYRLKAAANEGFDYLDAGAAIYRSEYTGYEANGEKYKNAAWCGAGEIRPFGIHRKAILCIPAREDGHGTFFAKNWELIGFMGNPQFGTNHIPLELEPDPDPAPETRQFQMRVTGVSPKGIDLKLGLLTGDHFDMQERYDLPMGSNGTARLYLWDRVVEFSVVDGQVTAKVLPGTGFGPRYGRDLTIMDGGY
jgi:hypothetical protein